MLVWTLADDVLHARQKSTRSSVWQDRDGRLHEAFFTDTEQTRSLRCDGSTAARSPRRCFCREMQCEGSGCTADRDPVRPRGEQHLLSPWPEHPLTLLIRLSPPVRSIVSPPAAAKPSGRSWETSLLFISSSFQPLPFGANPAPASRPARPCPRSAAAPTANRVGFDQQCPGEQVSGTASSGPRPMTQVQNTNDMKVNRAVSPTASPTTRGWITEWIKKVDHAVGDDDGKHQSWTPSSSAMRAAGLLR